MGNSLYMYRVAEYTVGSQPLENIYEKAYSFVKNKSRIQDEIFIYLVKFVL